MIHDILIMMFGIRLIMRWLAFSTARYCKPIVLVAISSVPFHRHFYQYAQTQLNINRVNLTAHMIL